MESEYRFNKPTRDFFDMGSLDDNGDLMPCDIPTWKMRLIKWLLPIAGKEVARQEKVIRVLQNANSRSNRIIGQLRKEITDLKWQAKKRKCWE